MINNERIRPGFIPGIAGRLFVLEYEPEKYNGCSIVHVPAFAEEMNKSRRMVNLQAHILAKQGWRVTIFDLYGTGDSDGDFRDATWDIWMQDLRMICDLRRRTSGNPVWLWGHRMGALLALTYMSEQLDIAGSIVWQPVIRGDLMLTQFLRLRMASSMASDVKESVKSLRSRLDTGEELEVAGYRINPALASGLDGADAYSLVPPVDRAVICCEVSARKEPKLTMLSEKLMSTWVEAGVDATQAVVSGDPFWITQEITEVPQLVAMTTKCMETVTCPGGTGR